MCSTTTREVRRGGSESNPTRERGRIPRRIVRFPRSRVGLLFADLRPDVASEEVELTALEFKLLHHLISRPGRVQTREQLLSDVWGITSPLETRTVDTHVMRLREKLGVGRELVETVRGVGYRMADPQRPEARA